MAFGLKVKLEGVERIQTHLDRVANSAKVKDAVTKGTAIVLSTAKHYVPVASQPMGDPLRNSIHMTVEDKSEGIVGKVFAGGGHATYVEFGTGVVGESSHHPTAVKKGFSYAQYSWVYTPDGGEHFYTTKGYRARPFMYPALKLNKAKIKQMIANALKEDVRS